MSERAEAVLVACCGRQSRQGWLNPAPVSFLTRLQQLVLGRFEQSNCAGVKTRKHDPFKTLLVTFRAAAEVVQKCCAWPSLEYIGHSKTKTKMPEPCENIQCTHWLNTSRPQVNNVLSGQVRAKTHDWLKLHLPISLPNSKLSLKIISGADKDPFHVIASELCWSAPKDNCCFPICPSESFCTKGKQMPVRINRTRLELGRPSDKLWFSGCSQIGQQPSVEVGDVARGAADADMHAQCGPFYFVLP